MCTSSDGSQQSGRGKIGDRLDVGGGGPARSGPAVSGQDCSARPVNHLGQPVDENQSKSPGQPGGRPVEVQWMPLNADLKALGIELEPESRRRT